MPTQVDTPINTGTTQWGLWGSAPNKVAAVSTNDGDTSVVYASSGGRLIIDTYRFPPIEGVGDPVTSVAIGATSRMYLKGAGGRAYYIRYNNARVGANRQAEVRWAGGYIHIWYNATGGELALAAVNGQHGMEFSAAGGPSNKAEYFVTWLRRSVTFDYSSGGVDGYARFIGTLAAAIGGNLLLRDIVRISEHLGNVRFLPHEYEPALRAWNAQKHMVMV